MRTRALTNALEWRFADVRESLESPARTTRSTVVIGRLLGLAFVVCLATGFYSHLLQDPPVWLTFVTWPNLYQVTQTLHVASGTAAIPLLLVKLWTVYPRLFVWPAVTSKWHVLERASIAVLVAASLVEVATGLLNTAQWYPWGFSFRRVHFGLAIVIMGALAVHFAVHLPKIRQYWRRDSEDA